LLKTARIPTYQKQTAHAAHIGTYALSEPQELTTHNAGYALRMAKVSTA
jgi:hypothetical protein